ncbi:MAG: enoyl-CoA hydratase-related protein [Egibacteraceae bacterium]
MADELYLERDGDVAILVLNRPEKRNAIRLDMYQRLPQLLREVATDPDILVLVVRGGGERTFSAGADISEFRTVRADSDDARVNNAAVAEAENALAGLDKPTIAMVHGHCIGGGCGLALACDFRFSDPDGRFGITPAKLGLVYSLESSKRLVDLVGPSQAKYILLSGEQLPADRALRLGLVNEVVGADQLAVRTAEFAALLASRAQFTVRSMKEIVRRISAGQAADDAATTELRDASFDTDDYAEGVAAFLERRPPKFTWR